jgi:hypothetical protein
MLFSPSLLKILQYVSLFIAYSIRARALVRKGFLRIIGFVQCSSIKKLVRISILLIMISTPYIIPANPLVKLFAEIIFTERMLLGIKVIGSIAFSAILRLMVLSLAPKSSKLRN